MLDAGADPDQRDPVSKELPRFAHRCRGDPDLRQQVPTEQVRQARSIDAVVLEPCCRDGFRVFGVGEDRLMSEALEQICQPPPCTGCLNRHPGGRGQLGKEAVHPVRSVCYPMLRQAPFGREHSDLRDALVQIHAHMYHETGLLPPRSFARSPRSQPIASWGWRPMLL
jgi:hypothetical protein